MNWTRFQVHWRQWSEGLLALATPIGLPPDPAIQMDAELSRDLSEADRAWADWTASPPFCPTLPVSFPGTLGSLAQVRHGGGGFDDFRDQVIG